MATQPGIFFRYRFHTEVCSLWDDMGTVYIDSDGRRIKLGDDTLGGSTVNYARYDTPSIVSNESLCKASSEKEVRNQVVVIH